MENKDYKRIICRAKSLGFGNSVTIDEMRDHYGEEVYKPFVELFSSYVRRRRESFTLDYYGSKLILTDKVDENGLPIVRYEARYTYYPSYSWTSFKDEMCGQIVNTLDRVCEILQVYIDKFSDKEMSAPFVQSNETRYSNNEYENMPSVDYNYYTKCRQMRNDNKNFVDWNKVSEICKKYGFEYTIINSTFGGNDCEFIIYTKPNFSHEEYESWRKAKDYDTIWKKTMEHKDVFKRLHDCVHELDIETALVFETRWVGNCGLFGSNDVKRQSYCFGSNFSEWSYIIDRWSPLIHDTDKHLKKGTYIMMTSHYMKKNNAQ